MKKKLTVIRKDKENMSLPKITKTKNKDTMELEITKEGSPSAKALLKKIKELEEMILVREEIIGELECQRYTGEDCDDLLDLLFTKQFKAGKVSNTSDAFLVVKSAK